MNSQRSKSRGLREELGQGLFEILFFFFLTNDRICCSGPEEDELRKNGALQVGVYVNNSGTVNRPATASFCC